MTTPEQITAAWTTLRTITEAVTSSVDLRGDSLAYQRHLSVQLDALRALRDSLGGSLRRFGQPLASAEVRAVFTAARGTELLAREYLSEYSSEG